MCTIDITTVVLFIQVAGEVPNPVYVSDVQVVTTSHTTRPTTAAFVRWSAANFTLSKQFDSTGVRQRSYFVLPLRRLFLFYRLDAIRLYCLAILSDTKQVPPR